MHTILSRQSKFELLDVLRERYQSASKSEKSKVLDEFIAVAGCHRKHAIRLLTAPCESSSRALSTAVGQRTYCEAVREAIIILWESADRICGKRLKAVLPTLLASLERHGRLNLDPSVRQRVVSISAATIDRLLVPVRSKTSTRKKRKSSPKPSQHVRVRTFADWDEPPPGFLEIDFVAHGGSSMRGTFLWSLVATDVCSGWTEAIPLVAREQSLVTEGLEVIRRQLPFPLLGIDSDNDSAFINDTVLAYCQQHALEFTRSRAYRKNDQAWIEQKNGAVVRRFVGYERFSGVVAGQCLAGLYQSVRLYVNHFQPSFKLRSKIRVGAKVRKSYHAPASPSARLLAYPGIPEAVKEKLRTEENQMDPLELLHRIRDGQSALAALVSHDPGRGPEQHSLEQFLEKLPQLWLDGEVRPTHRGVRDLPRTWRTRKDPFAGVWAQALGWLQEDPDVTAMSLFERLQHEHPGRFLDGQLRTLQRRVRQWRKVIARELVHVCVNRSEHADSIGALSAIGQESFSAKAAL
jgi:hypothetical protein